VPWASGLPVPDGGVRPRNLAATGGSHASHTSPCADRLAATLLPGAARADSALARGQPLHDGDRVRTGAGDGVTLPAAGQPPTEVARWGAPRIAAAFASVGLSP